MHTIASGRLRAGAAAACIALLLSAGAGLGQIPGSPPLIGAPTRAGDSLTVWPDSGTARRDTTRTVQPAAELKVVRRHYRFRQQVALALAMMVFAALMMTAAQSLNPE
jgi:thiamine monophosphate kinase